MARKVKFRAGLEGAERELEVEVHDLDAAPWGVGAELVHVGTDVLRVDGPQKAAGTARYTYDVARPRLAHAKMLRSPHAHAVVKSVDLGRAESMPGVLAAEALAAPGERVTFAGQEVAAVCAETEEQARDALRAVRVAYEVLPVAATTEDADAEGAPRVDPRRANRAEGRPQTRGDPEAALAAAEAVVRGEFRTAVQTHSALETHGTVVEPTGDGAYTVWASTQDVRGVRAEMARVLGVRQDRVRVVTEFMGGGFGAKFGIDKWDEVAARFAKRLGRPVKCMLERREEHLAAGCRPDSIQRLTLGALRDGTITVLDGEALGTPGNGTQGAGAANTVVYRIPNLRMRQVAVSTFTGGARAFRAPGHPQGLFALEGIVDALAHELGMDPLELRLRNDPHPVRQIQWREGARRIGWEERRGRAPGADAGPVKRGVGCAASIWYQKGGGTWNVNVTVDRSGEVTVANAAQDIGTGTKTVLAVMVAEELGIDPQRVRVLLGDTSYPPGPASGGSTTTPSLAPAAREAGLRAREALAAALAEDWGCQAGEVTRSPAGFAGPGGRKASFDEACRRLGPDGIAVAGQRRPNYEGFHAETAGCQFAAVAVDVETGVVRVEHVVAVQDAGRILSALTARSQLSGGVLQGISYALYEERRLDRNLGDMVNPTLDTYRILGMADSPRIDCVLTSVESGFNNAGAMGLGEPATVPTAAAVANAVFHATGVRMYELPMTPARVLAALGRAR